MRLLIITFILSCLTCTEMGAQDYKTKQTANKKALKNYQKGRESYDKDKALRYYEKAMEAEPRFIDAMIERAGILYERKDPKAERAMEEIVDIAPHYNTKILYSLGNLKKRLGKYKEAIVHYQRYIKAPKSREGLVAKCSAAIADCEFSMEASARVKPEAYTPHPLGKAINTTDREYFPSLSADGETLFFTRRSRGQEDIFYSKKQSDGKWGAPQPMREVNTTDNEGNQSISADGKVIVFTACNRKHSGYGSCDLFITEYKNGRWTKVMNMGKGINSRHWESQPAISADGNFLFFTSKRPGAVGKADIFYSKRNAEGAWSLAKPIRGEVNSTGDEQSPFLHQDGQTLYFKSNGHPGYGGYDLYCSRLQADGTWGKPVNLGEPINGPGDEGSFIVSLDGKTAYFDSDKKQSGKGNGEMNTETLHDLYRITLPEAVRPLPVTYVKAKILDADTRQPLSAEVRFSDVGQGQPLATKRSGTDGEFLLTLPAGRNYALNVSKEGYLFHSEHFGLEKGGLDAPYVLEILLQAIPPAVAASPNQLEWTKTQTPTAPTAPAKPIILRNVFFDSGSAVLRPESETELMSLHALLSGNPKMNIQINGHTDNVGKDTDNLRLSEARAEEVYQFLISKGIPANRLSYKGFGETRPIEGNDTPAGRAKNRRTEFLVK